MDAREQVDAGTAGIAVMVPTFRRPESLVAALASLGAQDTGQGTGRDTGRGTGPFPILVVDNDQPAGEGGAAARAFAAAHGLADRLTVVPAPRRGLAACRNAGLAAAFARPGIAAVAMIDDDATADPDWMGHLAMALAGPASDAALLGGPVLYAFPEAVPDWLRAAEPYAVPYRASGPVPRLRSSNNCLITRRVHARLGPDLFDPAFDASGGEDAHLFARCRAANLRAAWVSGAVVREVLGAARCGEAWLRRRQFNGAANAARIDRALHGAPRAAARQAGLIAKEVVGGGLRLASGDPGRRLTGRLRLAGTAGRLHGLLGRPVTHA